MWPLKRRAFVKGGIGLVAGEVLSVSQSRAQAGSSIAVARTSQLFEQPSGTSTLFLQDLFVGSDVIIALYGDKTTRRWWIGAMNANGASRWVRELPKGTYVAVGGGAADASSAIVHALTCYPSEGQPVGNCFVQVDPASGAVSVLGGIGARVKSTGGPTGRMTYVGGSRFVYVSNGQVEVWNTNGAPRLEITGALSSSFGRRHIDRISDDLVAFTDVAGDAFSTMSLTSGAIQDHKISDPTVGQARAAAQTASAGGRINPVRVTIGVIALTGSDGKGLVYAHLTPFQGAGAPVIALDASANVHAVGSYAIPLGGSRAAPVKLAKMGAELGFVCGDGTVWWCPV